MSMFDIASREAGGPAAIRGYRLQVLYALERLLAGPTQLLLEGIDDIDILSSSGEIAELIQVKALNAPLTLSALSSSGGSTGFFQRLSSSATANARGELVSFGPVGPELRGAFSGNTTDRDSVLRKLHNDYGIADADNVLRRSILVDRDEDTLYAQLERQVITLCPTATAATSLQLLCSWLLLCAETRRTVSRDDAMRQLWAAGQFAVECRAYAEEWFRTIRPLVCRDIQSAAVLRGEFFEGISARHDHILANVDVSRPRIIRAIHDAFQQTKVVILHGASGEGKSTILYRYAEDHGKTTFRFVVDVDADFVRSETIGSALSSYALHSNADILLLIDVRPGNRDWTRIVERLAASPNVRIIVGIREEEWREAHDLTYRVHITDIPLRLDEAEAEEVFAQLQGIRSSSHFLSFSEAWAAFGGGGPMLEFVHLVTQHQSLRARLRGQIEVLSSASANENEMEFVRLAACGTGYGGRVSLKGLMETSGLEPTRCVSLVRRLETEYFLRRSNTGEWLEPVHTIRSRILCELLFDAVLKPFCVTMRRVAPLIAEDDLEGFVFESFLVCEPKDLIAQEGARICIERRVGWRVLSGVLRALLWLDLDEYVTCNTKFVAIAKLVMPGAWRFLLPWAFSPNWSAETTSSLADMRRVLMQKSPDMLQAAETLANNVPPLAYKRVSAFLRRDWDVVRHPENAMDWLAIGEISFWCETLNNGDSDPSQYLADGLQVPPALPIIVQADLVSRGSLLGSTQWRDVAERTIARYRIVSIDDAGDGISATFLLGAREGQELIARGDKALNARAIDVVSCLRALVPGRSGYGCIARGWPVQLLPHNPVHKRAMKQRYLTSRWSRRVLPVIMQMLERTGLPATWREHAESVVAMRTGFVRGLQVVLGQALSDLTWNGMFTDEERDQIVSDWTDKIPEIPICARDPWCVGELSWREDQDENLRWYPERYDGYIRALQAFHADAIGLMYQLAPPHSNPIKWERALNLAIECWGEIARLHKIDRSPLRSWWPDDQLDHQEVLERTFLLEVTCFLGAKARGEEISPHDAVAVSKRETFALLQDIADRAATDEKCSIRVEYAWERPQWPAAIIVEVMPGVDVDKILQHAKEVCWDRIRASYERLSAELRTFLQKIEIICVINGFAFSVTTLSALAVLIDDRESFLGSRPRSATRGDAEGRSLRVVEDAVLQALGSMQIALIFPATSIVDLLESWSPKWNQAQANYCLDELASDLEGAIAQLQTFAQQDRDSGNIAILQRQAVLSLCEQALASALDRKVLMIESLVKALLTWTVARTLENAMVSLKPE